MNEGQKSGTVYAIIRNEDGSPGRMVGPVKDRNAIKVALRPFKRTGATAVVVSSLKARTGTSYSVTGTKRDGRQTFGSGMWARGEQVTLTEDERNTLKEVTR